MRLCDLMETYGKVTLSGDSAECFTRKAKYVYWHNSETRMYELVRSDPLQ